MKVVYVMTKSNFDFLVESNPTLAKIGINAEKVLYADPNASMVKVRQFAEALAETLVNIEEINLDDTRQVIKLNALKKDGVLEEDIFRLFTLIRRKGNDAAHNGMHGTIDNAIRLLESAHYLASWYMEVYVDYEFHKIPFITPPNTEKVHKDTILKLEEENAKLREEYTKTLAKRKFVSEIENDSKKKRRERATVYSRNNPLSEAQTRELIDEQLRIVGWEADTEVLNYKTKKTMPQKNRKMAIAEWKCGSKYADYALFDGLTLVGIVEAKKYDKDISSDIEQAKTYARLVEKIEGIVFVEMNSDIKVPFLYATNGREYIKQFETKSGIWFLDARNPKDIAKALNGWHSAEDLRKKLEVNQEDANGQLEKNKKYPEFAGRYYQREAIEAVEQAIIEGKDRILLSMATGTGKTRTAMSLMYRLLDNKRMRRILFLVDRKSLGTQAHDAIKDAMIDTYSFADIYDIKGLAEQRPEETTRIHIATVQGMVKRLFYSEDPENSISIGEYDMIIVDEAHRGYTEDRDMTDDEFAYFSAQDYMSQYRRVIDYFEATVLGLTATPALHTTKIFGKPVYEYGYKDAVIDGFLVDHNPPHNIKTKLSEEGIHFNKGEQVTLWDENTQNIDKAELEDELDFDVEDFNRKVITESFNREVVNYLTDKINPLKKAKTLIFATTNKHANLVVDLLNKSYKEKGFDIDDNTIMKITGDVHDVEEKIKRFKNEQDPNIVVTVDLLTTGIDVPKITNLVFLRRVRSRILYEQMLGRATRRADEIEKDSFEIFDAVKLYSTLEKVSDMTPVVKHPKQKTMDIYQSAIETQSEEDYGFYKAQLLSKLQRKKVHIPIEDRKEIAELANHQTLDSFITSIKGMSKEELKKNERSIQRIAEFKKPKNAVVISEHEDELLEVTRGYGEGNVAPGDYLEEFNQFIKENVNKISALNILVNRPSDLTREELKNIKHILSDRQFNEQSLQTAWKEEKNEKLAADIISFIRQAAIGDPLSTPEQRISNAMNKVRGMADWNVQQEDWLDHIENQLKAEPVLAPTAKQAFEEIDIFKARGGFKMVDKIFKGRLNEIVEVINDNMYA